jgi:hypothetical protein
MKRWCLAAAFTAAAFVIGCGASGPKMYDVTGTVKYDGKDVADGDILFQPADPAVGPDGGKIVDGKFSLKVKEGKHTVRIKGSRVFPGKKGAMGEDWVDQYLPDKYNEKSELSAEVGSGKTEHNFDLKK